MVMKRSGWPNFAHKSSHPSAVHAGSSSKGRKRNNTLTNICRVSIISEQGISKMLIGVSTQMLLFSSDE